MLLWSDIMQKEPVYCLCKPGSYIESAGVVSVSDMAEQRLGGVCALLSPSLLNPLAHDLTIFRRSSLKRTPMKTYNRGLRQA